MDKAFGDMVSKHLEMYWPKDPNEENLIRHIITWRPLISYFVRFSKSLNHMKFTELEFVVLMSTITVNKYFSILADLEQW